MDNEIDRITLDMQRIYKADDMPWVVTYSGGKDSTAVLQLVWTAIAGLEKSELHNQSVDVSYSIRDDYSFTTGLGFIVDGEAKSSTLNLNSTEVNGYRALGMLGINFDKWELLGGYQYSVFEYKSFSTTKNLSLTGGLMVFGIGIRF